jgi:hypothetical protein
MTFHAIRTGHIANARKLLADNDWTPTEKLAEMSDGEIETLISERYVALVLQEDVMKYDDIYLVPKTDFKSIYVIKR